MSSMAVRRYTPDDLLRMPDGKHFELVDGRLVEHNLGCLGSWVAGQLSGRVGAFCQANPLGWALGPAQYSCFPGRPNLVRKPDLSFVRFGRFPEEQIPALYCTIPPDLVGEVVPAQERCCDAEVKVLEYLQAGVRLVWVVNPKTRMAYAYHPDGSTTRLHEDQQLNGEEVLPGFACRVGDLFPPPPARTSPNKESQHVPE